MARYVVSVRTPKSAEESFGFMADLSNFEEWDPGVKSSTQVVGSDVSVGSEFDVLVNAIPRPLTMRYELTAVEAPESVTAIAETKMLRSVDTITVEPLEEGSVVTYDAELTMKGLAKLFDPVLALTFNRIGDKAAAGLIKALDGEKV